MNGFIGRRTELGLLNDMLHPVKTGGRGGRPGRAVLIRGRRRVGKSRLVEEFLERAELPHVFFTAVGGSREEDLAGFVAEVAASSLPDAARFADFTAPQTWDAALSLLASALPTDTPSVVVLDEMPYLVREDPAFEGTLQKVFDRTLSKLPVLLVLIGSDIAMMEQLNTYGRPFYQRGTEMVVPPLNPAEVADHARSAARRRLRRLSRVRRAPADPGRVAARRRTLGLPGACRTAQADLGPTRQRRAHPGCRVPHRSTGPYCPRRHRARRTHLHASSAAPPAISTPARSNAPWSY